MRRRKNRIDTDFASFFKNASPSGVPADLQSGVKKCPNLFRICGFAIRSKEYAFFFCWGIKNPPFFIGRTFLTADCKSAGTPSGACVLDKLRRGVLWLFPLNYYTPFIPLFCPFIPFRLAFIPLQSYFPGRLETLLLFLIFALLFRTVEWREPGFSSFFNLIL